MKNFRILPDLPNLIYLHCSWCPKLEKISNSSNLTHLYCHSCPKLAKLPDRFDNLIALNCSWCPRLTKLPDRLENLTYLNCSFCPWLNHDNNKEYLKNTLSLKKLQRWVRLNKFIRLTNSKDFCEYFYSPDQLGGKWAKKQLYKNIGFRS